MEAAAAPALGAPSCVDQPAPGGGQVPVLGNHFQFKGQEKMGPRNTHPSRTRPDANAPASLSPPQPLRSSARQIHVEGPARREQSQKTPLQQRPAQNRNPRAGGARDLGAHTIAWKRRQRGSEDSWWPRSQASQPQSQDEHRCHLHHLLCPPSRHPAPR